MKKVSIVKLPIEEHFDREKPLIETKFTSMRIKPNLYPFLGDPVGLEGVVAPWCNHLTLQPEQSDGVGSIPGRTPPHECHDKGSRTRLGLLYFCDPCA